jgi:hypothetical protein
MNSQMNDKDAESVAKILERIRARLSQQIGSDAAARQENPPLDARLQPAIPRFRALLDELRVAQGEIGAVNPRPSGIFNDLIQLFKRALGRVLQWYVRPIARYQETTTQFLGEATEILERFQSELQSLEAKTAIQAGELADLRERVLAKLDSIAQQFAERERERS